MSTASGGSQPAASRLSVNEVPWRIIGKIAELRRRKSRFVIDSEAISQDSTSVMPPANRVANERVTWATDSCTTKLPASGILRASALTCRRPVGVRDQMNKSTDAPITSGPNQITFEDSHRERPTTICVTVGSSLPNPENNSDIRGTT